MISTCGKCGGHLFQVQNNEPAGSAFIIYFVQCSSCGNPVGVLEYANSAALLEGLDGKIDNIKSIVDNLDYQIQDISRRIKN